MKPKIKFILLSLFLAQSALIKAYVPPFINITSFDSVFETHLNFGFGTVGAEQSLSIALSDNTHAFFNSTFSIDSMNIKDAKYSHKFFSIGYGYHIRSEYSSWTTTINGGYTYGEFGAAYNSTEEYWHSDELFGYDHPSYNNISFRAHRIFINLHQGVTLKNFEAFVGASISVGDYRSFNYNDPIIFNSRIVFEPDITVKTGFDKMKVFIQLKHSFNNFHYTDFTFPLGNIYATFGLEIQLIK
ncbi:MAG: hypothetical protein JXR60_01445 [Bacteroidales bacterium]|nr:hypothetical protein [Bacteroidales bacterium]